MLTHAYLYAVTVLHGLYMYQSELRGLYVHMATALICKMLWIKRLAAVDLCWYGSLFEINVSPLVAGRYGHSLVGVPLPDSSPPQCLVVSFGGYDETGRHCGEPEMLRILQVG